MVLEVIFRWFFKLLDFVVYWAVNLIYRLFIMLSETGVFTQENINQFAGRIYVLLGIFMLFKVSFSMINYVLNPDDMADKSKGMGKLVQNFFVVLIGIVAVPYVFQAAFGLQAIVLKENVIGSLIMGMNASSVSNNENYIQTGGSKMSFTTLSAFITLNPSLVGEECAEMPIVEDDDGNKKLSDYCKGKEALSVVTNYDDKTVGEVLTEAYNTNNVNLYAGTNLVTLTYNDQFIFNYNFVISTIAGGFLAWILLIFCIDVATRSVKLGFLQLIAPIPIISYIDPKSGDKGVFKKWVGQCTNTYFDLFVRLIAIYFALFVITLILDSGIINIRTGEYQTNVFVIVFIIFGALMFAKQLPQLIADIAGVKFDGGGFTLNPMKKLGSSPYAAGAMGLVGGALGGGFANLIAAKKSGLGFLKGAGSVLAGMTSAGARGMMAGLTSDGKSSAWNGVSKGVQASNQARYNRDVYQNAGYSFWSRRMDDINKFAGVKNKDAGIGQIDKQMKAKKREMDDFHAQEQALRDEMAKFMVRSNHHPLTDFNTNSLYVGGERKINDKGEYEYVDWAKYQAAGGKLERSIFEQYLNLQKGIDHIDSAYEEARREYGRMEDVNKAKNINNKQV